MDYEQVGTEGWLFIEDLIIKYIETTLNVQDIKYIITDDPTLHDREWKPIFIGYLMAWIEEYYTITGLIWHNRDWGRWAAMLIHFCSFYLKNNEMQFH